MATVTKSADVKAMEIISDCGIHIINRGESVAKHDFKNKVFFHPGYCEEPELQELYYLLPACTFKSVTRNLSTGFQFHF